MGLLVKQLWTGWTSFWIPEICCSIFGITGETSFSLLRWLLILFGLPEIWRSVHQCAPFNLHDLQGYITRRCEEHLHTWALQQGSQVCNWTPPSLNVVKINCDAYVLQNKLIFVVVCRKLDGMLWLLE